MALLVGVALMTKPGYPGSFRRALKRIAKQMLGPAGGSVVSTMISALSATETLVGSLTGTRKDISVFKATDMGLFVLVESRDNNLLVDLFPSGCIFVGALGCWVAIEGTGKVHFASAME